MYWFKKDGSIAEVNMVEAEASHILNSHEYFEVYFPDSRQWHNFFSIRDAENFLRSYGYIRR